MYFTIAASSIGVASVEFVPSGPLLRHTMPRAGYHDSEDEDEPDGDDYDAETDYDPEDLETYPAGLYVDNERALVPCPHCQAEMDEEAEQCPECGMYVSKEDAPPSKKSAAWIVVMVLALIAVAMMMLLG